MTRLTNGTRDRITRNALDHRFKDAEQKLADDLHALAVAVYNATFSKKQRDLMASLPDGWLAKTSTITAQFGNSDRSYNRIPLRSGESMPIPENKSYSCLAVFDKDHDLAKRNEELADRKRELFEQRRKAQTQIEAVLASVSTVKKLLEIWPEAEPFTKEIEPVKTNLPAPQISELNALLGLKAAA